MNFTLDTELRSYGHNALVHDGPNAVAYFFDQDTALEIRSDSQKP